MKIKYIVFFLEYYLIEHKFYTYLCLEQNLTSIEIKNLNNNTILDTTILKVGTNDYIPAVYDNYFPTDGIVQTLTAAETLISYLKNDNDQVNYPNCDHYFRYQ